MTRHAHVLLLTFAFAGCMTGEDISALQLFEKVSANYAARFHGCPASLHLFDVATGWQSRVMPGQRGRSRIQRRLSTLTYWIDPTRYLILKVTYNSTYTSPDRPAPTTSSITVSLAKAKLSQPIEASLLRFDPPPGASEVQQLYFGGKSVLAGQSSPAFELKTTGGTLLTNASVKGTPVLLQFGHAWDDPGLLVLELMHRSLSSRGLLIYHVVPRDEGTPGTVPVAYDPRGSIAREFGIISSGMVLLDRQAKSLMPMPVRGMTSIWRRRSRLPGCGDRQPTATH